MSRLIWLPIIPIGVLVALWGQNPDIRGTVTREGGLPVMAIPDFRASGEAQSHMAAFNTTLWADIVGSGYLKMSPKTMYPLFVPQQPSDFVQPPPTPQTPVGRKGELVRAPSGGGRWIRLLLTAVAAAAGREPGQRQCARDPYHHEPASSLHGRRSVRDRRTAPRR